MCVTAAPLLVLTGPTASGKTQTAITLAHRLNGELISADSAAVYRGLDVGTAKPMGSQRTEINWHVLDVAEPTQQFSVADFRRLALSAIAGIRSRGKLPIIVGGTGLYIRALLRNWSLAETGSTDARQAIEQRALEIGSHNLHAELALADPATAARLHPNDVKRVVRALEVLQHHGKPLSEVLASTRETAVSLKAALFGLEWSRPTLYRRIDERVEQMLKLGLEAEVEGLLRGGCPANAPGLRCVGYREMVQYIQGELPALKLLSAIQQNTRNLARRQLVWWRAEPGLTWLNAENVTAGAIVDVICSRYYKWSGELLSGKPECE